MHSGMDPESDADPVATPSRRMELKFHCEYFLGALPARREKCNKYAYERAQLRGGASEGARSAQRPRSGVMAI